MFDFGLFVATEDDKSTLRNKKFKTPRDNVIFELGLFFGRLGKNRSYVILEGEAKLPSDMDGISVSKFTRTKKLADSPSLKKQIKI